jgi:predicted acylesterase/phospholipase RssA
MTPGPFAVTGSVEGGDMSEIDFVFEGGGAKGMVFVGALQQLQALRPFTPGRLLGTSAGAITATLMAAGYTPEEMFPTLAEKGPDGRAVFASFLGEPAPFDRDAIAASEIRRLLAQLDIPFLPQAGEQRVDDWLANKLASDNRGRHVFSFLERGGWYGAEAFLKWLRQRLNAGELNGKPRDFADMSLAEFRQATGRDLTLVAADTSASRMLLLNHRTAPQLPVVYAARMSMSVPLLWEEVVWRAEWGPYYSWDGSSGALAPNDLTGHEIVDGGLLSNFPIALFMANRPDVSAVMGAPKAKNVLGLLIDETLPVPNRPARPTTSGLAASLGGLSVARRLAQLANTATCAHDNMAKAVFAANVVRLPAGGYGTTQFDMSEEERDALLSAGRSAMQRFLSTQSVLEAAGGELDLSVSPASRAAADAIAATIFE